MTDLSLTPDDPGFWPDPKGTPRHSDLAERAPANPDALLRLAAARYVAMLRLWVPTALPANEAGQVHFLRALTDSVADGLEAALNGGEPDPSGGYPNSPEAPLPLDRLLACARRELALRKAVYPGMMARKSLASAKAGEEMVAMAAIVALLEAAAAPLPPPAKE